jgi:hypothetical protein
MWKSLAARLPFDLIIGTLVALALFCAAWSTWSADEPEWLCSQGTASHDQPPPASCTQGDGSVPTSRRVGLGATA